MSFLLHRSARALSCMRLVMSCARYVTAHRVDRNRWRERVALQKPDKLIPGNVPVPATPGEPSPPDMGGRSVEQGQRNRVACYPIVRKVAHQFLAQGVVLLRDRQVSVLPTPVGQRFQPSAEATA
jgi:hypothetical protein